MMRNSMRARFTIRRRRRISRGAENEGKEQKKEDNNEVSDASDDEEETPEDADRKAPMTDAERSKKYRLNLKRAWVTCRNSNQWPSF